MQWMLYTQAAEFQQNTHTVDMSLDIQSADLPVLMFHSRVHIFCQPVQKASVEAGCLIEGDIMHVYLAGYKVSMQSQADKETAVDSELAVDSV